MSTLFIDGIPPERNLRLHRSIPSELICRFLTECGWTKKDEAPGVVSLWIARKKKKVHSVLIPLDQASPTYPNMMIKALATLEKVERIEHRDLIARFSAA